MEQNKLLTIPLFDFGIPILQRPSLTNLVSGYNSGWYKVSDNIQHTYDTKLHKFHLNVPENFDEFYILFVPFTTGKYEEEVKYKLAIDKEKCTVYIREPVLFTNHTSQWSKEKTYNISHLFT
jgi:hypothetical protein